MLKEMQVVWDCYSKAQKPTLEQLSQLEEALKEKAKTVKLDREEQITLEMLSQYEKDDKRREPAVWQVFQYGV